METETDQGISAEGPRDPRRGCKGAGQKCPRGTLRRAEGEDPDFGSLGGRLWKERANSEQEGPASWQREPRRAPTDSAADHSRPRRTGRRRRNPHARPRRHHHDCGTTGATSRSQPACHRARSPHTTTRPSRQERDANKVLPTDDSQRPTVNRCRRTAQGHSLQPC